MIDLRKVYTVFLTEIQGNVIKKIMSILSERTLQKTERLWNVLRHTALGDASFYFGVYSAVRYSIAYRKKSRLQCFHEERLCIIVNRLHRAERHPDGGHA